MAIAYSLHNPPSSLYSPPPNPHPPNSAAKSSIPLNLFAGGRRNRTSPIVAVIRNSGCSRSLEAPLEPSSPLGQSLCDVLLHDPSSFYDAVSADLADLASVRDDAFDRLELSLGLSESCLHRRIAEQKEAEILFVIDDILYMIIYRKFGDIAVPLSQSIDKCIHIGSREISPSYHKQLKSIHDPEALEVVEDYLTTVFHSSGLPRSDPIKTEMLHLYAIYSSSISTGYFLKSVSLRHRLDRSLAKSCSKTLKSYLQGLDRDAVRVCKEMRSQSALFLGEDHTLSLFVAEDLVCSGTLMISAANLERLVLEGIAFGCFLWEAEEYVDGVFNLRKSLKSTGMV